VVVVVVAVVVVVVFVRGHFSNDSKLKTPAMDPIVGFEGRQTNKQKG
jgi:hypothetical protein